MKELGQNEKNNLANNEVVFLDEGNFDFKTTSPYPCRILSFVVVRNISYKSERNQTFFHPIFCPKN